AGLEIIPIINKIDLPSANPEEVAKDVSSLLGGSPEDVLPISAKEGTNVAALLEAIVEKVPPPSGDEEAPLQALIFDSHYDSYKGVIAYVRVVAGHIKMGDRFHLMATGISGEPIEIGTFSPKMTPTGELNAGEVGYVATGLKTVQECRVGDTLTLAERPAPAPRRASKKSKPMVFAGIYPVEGEDYAML